MSLRTKLIMLGVFFVMLAIPVVHGFLTWSPADPVRLRFIPVDEDFRMHEDHNDSLLLEVYAENRSSTTLQLHGEWPMDGPPPDVSMLSSIYKAIAQRDGPSFATRLPPGGTVRLQLRLGRHHYPMAREGRLWAGYLCQSQARHHATRFCIWFAGLLPEKWREHIPMPGFDQHATLIELPPDGSPVLPKVQPYVLISRHTPLDGAREVSKDIMSRYIKPGVGERAR